LKEHKSAAATTGDQAGELDPAQRLAAYLADERPVADEERPVEYTPSAPDRIPAAPVPSAPPGFPVASRAWASLCPYLLGASGTWRAVQPSNEHRCTAVTPAVPLRADKQRRLCLGTGHLECPSFLAAREVRARILGDVAAVSPGRPFARTAPVILQRPAAVAVAFSTLRTSLPQVGLVVLMLLGAAALVLARFVTP
jgi:hypothetical protein